MGLGGELMWTIFTKNYYNHYKTKPFLCKLPKFSDLMVGRMYDCNFTYNNSFVFIENKNFTTNDFKKKKKLIYLFDSIFEKIKNKFFNKYYQDIIFRISRKNNINLIYTNYYKNSYFFDYYVTNNHKAMIWNINYSFAEYLCNNYSVNYKYNLPEINFSNSEIEIFKIKIKKLNLNNYLVINTDSKEDYFKNIRKWPNNNWLKLINSIKKKYPDLNIVELNLKKPVGGDSVIPIGNLLTFRECGLLIKNSKLFIGTDGGLAHLSAAVKKKGIIIWSSLINEEITGYPDFHTIIKNKSECSNYGHMGWCYECIERMKEITHHEVYNSVSEYLDEL